MTIYKTPIFLKRFEKLPKEVQTLYKRQELLFQESWLHPLIHTKKLDELPGAFSFRITRGYRVLFYFRKETAIFFGIGHRKDIYKNL